MINLTSQYLLNKPNIITEATFKYDNNFCMIDILKNDYDGMEIYEVKSSMGLNEIYIDDASFQYYVVSNLGFNVKKVCIIYINSEYTLENELNLDELFKVEDITDIVLEKQDEIRDNINNANLFMAQHTVKEPDMEIGTHCINPYDCDFLHYCTKDLIKPNIFDIKGINNELKLKKYNEGKISFDDLKHDEDLSSRCLEQIDFELNNLNPKIDKKAIKDLIDSLKYPLYFLDYETIRFAIPVIEKTKPYKPALPFQYSLHILKDENAELDHKEFLAEPDDPDLVRHFADSLIGNIPDSGSVIVYSKYEKTINNNIIELYPEYKFELERINSNLVDFMEIFEQRKYYTKQMNGSYSLKSVLPALYPDDKKLDYSNLLLVHDGNEASAEFLSLNDYSSNKQEFVRGRLLEYCKLDTYALVKIYEKFRDVIK